MGKKLMNSFLNFLFLLTIISIVLFTVNLEGFYWVIILIFSLLYWLLYYISIKTNKKVFLILDYGKNISNITDFKRIFILALTVFITLLITKVNTIIIIFFIAAFLIILVQKYIFNNSND